MIGSLFKELPPIPETEVSELAEDLLFETDSDDSIIAALPVVQKIVSRRGLLYWQTEASDLVQGIILRLLKWRRKYQAKSEEMTSEEWQSFVARTAYNEVNRDYANSEVIELPLDLAADVPVQYSIEGQSNTEVISLARGVWQKICNLTLRQRQGLLLSSDKLLMCFILAGITDEEFAASLELRVDDWLVIKDRIPLKGIQIAEIIKAAGHQNSLESIINSVKKARYEARGKVRRVTDK